ncbi:hypothetical protein P154DRAFT_312812 [Amniculicola lignicola CBS 123094]|uniref:Uncharacterized protein n=1 Tax=Amniculicola lignicola CBS 123094 TaxID=1392246 RepID=A0A6A5WXR8_9PLEO|nr:hypothetical protein P154DRAFT_312812 [Amniculicola lignicola CBS 123094]
MCIPPIHLYAVHTLYFLPQAEPLSKLPSSSSSIPFPSAPQQNPHPRTSTPDPQTRPPDSKTKGPALHYRTPHCTPIYNITLHTAHQSTYRTPLSRVAPTPTVVAAVASPQILSPVPVPPTRMPHPILSARLPSSPPDSSSHPIPLPPHTPPKAATRPAQPSRSHGSGPSSKPRTMAQAAASTVQPKLSPTDPPDPSISSPSPVPSSLKAYTDGTTCAAPQIFNPSIRKERPGWESEGGNTRVGSPGGGMDDWIP